MVSENETEQDVPQQETPAEMARRLQALLPSPEEIYKQALIEEHNHLLDEKRKADLEERKRKRALRGKRKKRKKR